MTLGRSEYEIDEALRELALTKAAKESLAERLREASSALLDANRSLAQLPLLEHRVEELREQNAWLTTENQRLEAVVEKLNEESARLAGEVAALRAFDGSSGGSAGGAR